ncbi:MAG: T9SS type A sorting domain-containing protein [Bacteroidetes bacterium]|nr:T9SS type A sorting domain-containing protein [Bacteroidota bacterium]
MRIILMAAVALCSLFANAQTPNLHWAYRNNGPSFYEDRGLKTTIDNQGNVISTGYEAFDCTDIDIVTIKYNEAGDTLWKQVYAGIGTYNDEDRPTALITDQAGNIYVTGFSEDGSSTDMVTIKYSPAGVQLWASRYTAAVVAQGNDVAVDASGNVFTTGFAGPFNDKEFILVKYNSSGAQQWVQTYSVATSDEALKIAVDNAGNPVITGKTATNGFSFNYTTIKYNTSGAVQWTATYNSPLGNFSDEPVDLVIDALNNIYVTGFSNYTVSTSRDFLTIKYDPSGNVVWESNYTNTAFVSDDYPIDMVVDNAGNVYVTGSSIGLGTGQDILTIKINNSGQLVWEARVDSVNFSDFPLGMGLSPAQDAVYIGGYITTGTNTFSDIDWIALRYDTSGTELNRIIIDGPGNDFDIGHHLATGANGKIAMTGIFSQQNFQHINGDMSTVLLDDNLNLLWTRFDNGINHVDDRGSDMVVDEVGNSYVCGYSLGHENGYTDLIVFKVNASGDKQWEYRWTGTEETSNEKGVALVIDAQKNVYVTCTVDTSLTGNYNDIYTIKLDPNGVLVWENYFNGTAGGSDVPVGIAIDATGKIFIGGTTVSAVTGFDGLALCYDNNGNQLWATPFDNGGLGEIFTAMAIDANSNMYSAGGSNPVTGALTDGLLVKFDAAGTMLWDTTYDFSSASFDRDFFNSIAIDSNQDIIVAGQSNLDFVIAKYNPSGNPLWIQNYSFSSYTDSASAVVVDGDDNVLVGGTFGQFVEADFGVVKFDPAGNFLWAQKVANSAGADDILTDIAVDASGAVYLTGYETSAFTTNYNFMTVKYDSTGAFKYELIWSSTNGVEPDYGKKIALDTTGNLYIMGDANDNCFGNVFINGFRWDIQVLRYGQGIFSGIDEPIQAQNDLLVYPNPAHNEFTIALPLNFTTDANVDVAIYDVTGRQLYSNQHHGSHPIKINSSSFKKGLVFVSVISENGERRNSKVLVN